MITQTLQSNGCARLDAVRQVAVPRAQPSTARYQPAANNQPIGLCGRCQARMAPQMPKLSPIAGWSPRRPRALPPRTSQRRHSTPLPQRPPAARIRQERPPTSLSGRPARVGGVISQVCAEHPPGVPGRFPDLTGEASRLGADFHLIRPSPFQATLKAAGQIGRSKPFAGGKEKCLLSIAAGWCCSACSRCST